MNHWMSRSSSKVTKKSELVKLDKKHQPKSIGLKQESTPPIRGLVMYLRWKYCAIVLACVSLGGLLGISTVQGCEMQLDYGYNVGDTFHFKDQTITIVSMNQTHLVEETTTEFKVQITAIDENIDGYTIRVTAEILSLSGGLNFLNSASVMEGHTAIVSGPQVLFTHVDWGIHSHEFIIDANNYQASTQMTGSFEEHQSLHLFHWNFSRYVNATQSPYDINFDGHYDGYNVISGYLAHFNEEGVLLLREFITEFRFDNGANYYRVRQISQIISSPPPLFIFETGIILGVVIIAISILTLITFFWFRRSTIASE